MLQLQFDSQQIGEGNYS